MLIAGNLRSAAGQCAGRTADISRRLLAVVLVLFATLATAAAQAATITVYKDPNCGCCENWVAYLRHEGFDVKAIDSANLPAIKRKFGVSAEMSSCHTAVVDGYVIEGHVPAAPIRRLLRERPTTQGLSVPGMPANSPGMGPMDGRLRTYTLEGAPYSTD